MLPLLKGLQEEKDKKETELLELQKSVNETKSTVSALFRNSRYCLLKALHSVFPKQLL